MTKRYRVAAINRGPLAMGLLSGKYTAATTVSVDDVRGEKAPEWMQYFQNGKPHPAYVARLAPLRELLTADGAGGAGLDFERRGAHSPHTGNSYGGAGDGELCIQ